LLKVKSPSDREFAVVTQVLFRRDQVPNSVQIGIKINHPFAAVRADGINQGSSCFDPVRGKPRSSGRDVPFDPPGFPSRIPVSLQARNNVPSGPIRAGMTFNVSGTPES
jgi:hypothetical protein